MSRNEPIKWFLVLVIVAAMVLPSLGCAGKGAKGDGDDDDTITLTGKVSRRGSTPFSVLMFQATDQKIYTIQPSLLGDELRRLEDMDVAITGKVVGDTDGIEILLVEHYELLQFPTGERPVVGFIRSTASGSVWIIDDMDVYWSITGDFSHILRDFNGAKVWLVGLVRRAVNTGGGAYRSIHVTDYGIIRQ